VGAYFFDARVPPEGCAETRLTVRQGEIDLQIVRGDSRLRECGDGVWSVYFGPSQERNATGSPKLSTRGSGLTCGSDPIPPLLRHRALMIFLWTHAGVNESELIQGVSPTTFKAKG
jgi:hypothetical protein